MDRIYQPHLPDVSVAIAAAADLPAFLGQPLTARVEGAERACFDRYLRILDSIETHSMIDPSLLDIGCANGFFAYLFAITACRQVTAIDDARASSCGYSDNAFLAPLRQTKRELGLEHLEIVDTPMEQYLTECPGRQWDIVLCLSVLHHFYTGYGDDPDTGQLTDEQRVSVFRAIGQATRSVLFLEVDHGRVPESFVPEFVELAGFKGADPIGSSASAVGDTRLLFELWK
jgi:SAM-dependent methyltransferase